MNPALRPSARAKKRQDIEVLHDRQRTLETGAAFPKKRRNGFSGVKRWGAARGGQTSMRAVVRWPCVRPRHGFRGQGPSDELDQGEGRYRPCSRNSDQWIQLGLLPHAGYRMRKSQTSVCVLQVQRFTGSGVVCRCGPRSVDPRIVIVPVQRRADLIADQHQHEQPACQPPCAGQRTRESPRSRLAEVQAVGELAMHIRSAAKKAPSQVLRDVLELVHPTCTSGAIFQCVA